jgi:hypothetical protein
MQSKIVITGMRARAAPELIGWESVIDEFAPVLRGIIHRQTLAANDLVISPDPWLNRQFRKNHILLAEISCDLAQRP